MLLILLSVLRSLSNMLCFVYFLSLSNISGSLSGLFISLYYLSGLCIVFWGFVYSSGALYSILMCPHPNLSPLPSLGPTAAAAVAQGGAGGPPCAPRRTAPGSTAAYLHGNSYIYIYVRDMYLYIYIHIYDIYIYIYKYIDIHYLLHFAH